MIHKHVFNVRMVKVVCHAEGGFRNELDLGVTHGAQSKAGEICLQAATKYWPLVGYVLL